MGWGELELEEFELFAVLFCDRAPLELGLCCGSIEDEGGVSGELDRSMPFELECSPSGGELEMREGFSLIEREGELGEELVCGE